MGGFNSMEGSLILSSLSKVTKADNITIEQGINQTTVITILDDFATTYFPKNPKAAKSRLISVYFSKGELSPQVTATQASRIVDMYTDLMFGAPTLRFLDAHSEERGGTEPTEQGSTYMYIFTHETPDSQQINPAW